MKKYQDQWVEMSHVPEKLSPCVCLFSSSMQVVSNKLHVLLELTMN